MFMTAFVQCSIGLYKVCLKQIVVHKFHALMHNKCVIISQKCSLAWMTDRPPPYGRTKQANELFSPDFKMKIHK